MEPLSQNFKIKGNNNIQAGRDIYVINVSYSDVKTFEKVLKSIPPESFIKDVLMPFIEIHKEFKAENIITDLEALLQQK